MSLILSPGGHVYNAKRSPVDVRDFGFSSIPRLLAVTPPKVDLEPNCGPVRNQGQKGSCTGHAGYADRMYLANAYQGNKNKIIFSPEEIYDQARVLDGTIGLGDSGSTGRSIVRVLNRFGACPEGVDPYTERSVGVPPSPEILG